VNRSTLTRASLRVLVCATLLTGAAAPAAAESLPSPACDVRPDGGSCHWDGPTRGAQDTFSVPEGVEQVSFVAKGDSTCRYVPGERIPACAARTIVTGHLDVSATDSIDISVGGYMGSANISLVSGDTSTPAVFAPGWIQNGSTPFGPEGSVITRTFEGGPSQITLTWTV